MSYAATHRQHHIHVPWMTLVAVAVAVAAVAAVLVLVNRPDTRTAAGPAEIAPAVAVGAAAVPAPESPALRRLLAEEVATPLVQTKGSAYPRNHVIGTTLAPLGATAAVPGRTAALAAPNDPHPLNHFPSEP